MGFVTGDEEWTCIFSGDVRDFSCKDVAWCVAYDIDTDAYSESGEYIEVVLRLKWGQFVWCSGGYEITGWDVAHITCVYASTPEELKPLMSDEAVFLLFGIVR